MRSGEGDSTTVWPRAEVCNPFSQSGSVSYRYAGTMLDFGNYRWSPVRFAASVAPTAPISGTVNPRALPISWACLVSIMARRSIASLILSILPRSLAMNGVAEEDVAGLLREALEPGRVEPGQVAAISAELFVDLAGEGTHHAARGSV